MLFNVIIFQLTCLTFRCPPTLSSNLPVFNIVCFDQTSSPGLVSSNHLSYSSHPRPTCLHAVFNTCQYSNHVLSVSDSEPPGCNLPVLLTKNVNRLHSPPPHSDLNILGLHDTYLPNFLSAVPPIYPSPTSRYTNLQYLTAHPPLPPTYPSPTSI